MPVTQLFVMIKEHYAEPRVHRAGSKLQCPEGQVVMWLSEAGVVHVVEVLGRPEKYGHPNDGHCAALAVGLGEKAGVVFPDV